MFIRSMSNAAVHFGGGVAMGVLTVFAAVGALGMMMGDRNRSTPGGGYGHTSPPPDSAAGRGFGKADGI